MIRNRTLIPGSALVLERRDLLRWTSMLAAASGVGIGQAQAQTQIAPATPPLTGPVPREAGGLHKGMIGYMLAHEQLTVPDLV